MIAFDFEYYKVSSIDEAITTYNKLQSNSKKVLYYGGGTEIISRARMNEIAADAIIDLKGIPQCNELLIKDNTLVIGSTVTLTTISEANYFPLLSNVIRMIATKTERNKITIGGNIASHLIYKEGLLPFLLADSRVIIAGLDGKRNESVSNVFKNGMNLKEGEFIVQILTNNEMIKIPHCNAKKTKQSNVNYPIVSLATVKVDDQIRVAFSGVCDFPFRIIDIDQTLSDTSISIEDRVQQAIKLVPNPILDDIFASMDYRKFALESALTEIMEKVEETA